MRILHWDEMFHPTFGYQINVLPKYQVKQGHEVIILTSEKIEKHPTFSKFGNNIDIANEDKKYTEKYGVRIIRLPIHKVISGRVIYKKGFIKKIKELSPDVLMCHTNDTLSSIRITQKYKSLGIPIVFDNHMLEMASKNPLNKLFRIYFKNFVTPIIIKNNLTVIRTQDDNYVNKHLGIPSHLTPFISFGSDTTLFHPDLEEKRILRTELNIDDDEFVVIYTGKLTESKGGKLLANAFLEKFGAENKVTLVVVSNSNGEYEKEVDEIFAKSKNRILRFPTQNYFDLPKFYKLADLSVFPKQCSLSFFDAQATGLPVIAEDNNVNIERLSHNNGFVYETDNIESFKEAILKVIRMSNKEYKIISRNSFRFVKKNYDYSDIASKYTSLLHQEVKKYKNDN